MNDLPIGWCWSDFVQLAEPVKNALKAGPFGSTLKKEFYVSSGYKIYGQEQVIKEDPFYGDYYIDYERYKALESCSVKPGDILISLVGTIGKVLILPEGIEPGLINPRLVKLSLDKRLVISEFVKNYLESPEVRNRFSALSHGGTMDILNLTTLKTLPIPLPPLGEQGRIVEKLDELLGRSRHAREELQQIPKLIQRYKQAVLAAAFRGDLTADWREEHSEDTNLKLFEHVQLSREQEYKKEVLDLKKQNKNTPKLPEFQGLDPSISLPISWIAVSVESACLFIIDCLHSTPKFTNEGDYCIDTTCIQPGKIIWSQARKVSEDEFNFRTSRMLPLQGDILFSREGTIGTAVKVTGEHRFCLGQRMMMFRFSSAVLPEYAELYLQSPIFSDQYKPLTIGTSSPHLNIGSIRKLSFFIPPLAEQKEIVRRVEERFKAIETIEQNYQKAIALLDRLDQATLAKAFRGQLVPQDPNDEPAAVLLERIRADRAQQPTPRKRKPKASQ